MLSRLSTLAAMALALSMPLALPAHAQESADAVAPSLADLPTDTRMAAAFATMVGEREIPAWVRENAVTSPGDLVNFGGREYLAMSACEQHLCGPHRIAVLYDAEGGVMYGGITNSDDEAGTEELSWLNIGGGPESIDGKSLLYATLTGSVTNHPQYFRYQAEASE